MKINATLLLCITLGLIAAKTNPSVEMHENTLLNGLNRLNSTTDQLFIQNCEFYDYFLFSYTAYMGDPVSIGLLGNVHVLYNFLDHAADDFHARQQLLPNQGRGAPETIQYRF